MINDVGTRMLVLRKLHGWSQRQLAKRSGVPHSAISMIEHGQVSPSVNSLKKVLDGVPMSLSEFFSLDINQRAASFYKADALKNETFGDVTRMSLLTDQDGKGILMTREKFPPGSDTGEDMVISAGEQAGFIVKGKIELTVGGEIQILEEGDAFHFPRRRPYRFRNPGNETCEVISTILPEKGTDSQSSNYYN